MNINGTGEKASELPYYHNILRDPSARERDNVVGIITPQGVLKGKGILKKPIRCTAVPEVAARHWGVFGVL